MYTEQTGMFDLWVERWKRSLSAAQAHGAGKSTRLEIAPPATESQVRNVETALNVPIPPQFRRTLLEFSGRVDFYWYLNDIRPPSPLSEIFCGGCHWDIERLIKDYHEVVWLAKNAFVENVPGEQLWQAKFPFHSIVTGDFVAIDQASLGNQSIVYLSHELNGSHAHWLGYDFFDFMDR